MSAPLRIESARRTELYADVADHLAPDGRVLVQLTRWANGEGADVSIGRAGQMQTVSLTDTELDAIAALHLAGKLSSPPIQ